MRPTSGSAVAPDYEISDTGMVPRGLRVFSLSRSNIVIPPTARFIQAAVQPPNGAGSVQMAAPKKVEGHDQPAGVGHNSGAQPMPEDDEVEGDAKAARIAILREQIAMVIGAQRHAAMTASDIGKLANLPRLKILRTSVLLGAVRHCRRNPMADTRLAILVFVTFLSDNDLGMCRLSVRRIGRILGRSKQAIGTSIASLEKDGQIGVIRREGAGSYYWPLIPNQLATADPHIVWLLDAIDRYDETVQGALTVQGDLDSTNPSKETWTAGGEPSKSRTYNRPSLLAPISLNSSLTKKDSGADAPGACATEDLLSEKAPPSAKDADCKPPSAETKGKRAAPRPKATEEQFNRFWAVYPKRDGKAKARERFVALSRDDAELAIAGAGAYAATCRAKGTEPQYVKWAQGWLNERRFEDYAPATAAAPADPDAALKALAESPDGRRVLARYGHDDGMRRLREIATGKGGA